MLRIALGTLAATVLLLVPATAQGDSSLRIRGTVALKDTASHVVTVRTVRHAVALRVPGSLAAVRVGQRVELRGSTLRAHGNSSRVLARNVTIASSAPLATPRRDDDQIDDDEVEMKGKIGSLSPLTVSSATRTVTCAVPAGTSLSSFAIGDLVEITCDLRSGTWVLRKLEREDDDDRGNNGGLGGGDDDDENDDDDHDDDDHDDDDHDDDHDDDDRGGPSGPGGGDDD